MNSKFIKKTMLTIMSTLMIMSTYSISALAEWNKDLKNNWSWEENGTKVVGWKTIDGNWYYFDKNGIMSIGWNTIDGKWYHFSESGHMSIGWIVDNGFHYFANSHGEMQTGTIKIDGKIYTFSNNGALLYSDSTIMKNTDVKSITGYVTTSSESLNVRSDATLSSDIIGTIAKGTEVEIVDNEKNGFYPITFNDKKGWVSSQWISFNKNKE